MKLFNIFRKKKEKKVLVMGYRYYGMINTYIYDTPEVDAVIDEFNAENDGNYRVGYGYTYADCQLEYVMIARSPIDIEIIKKFELKFNPERISINLRSLREQCYA